MKQVANPVRVLAADSSERTQSKLGRVLGGNPSIKLIGIVGNGYEAVAMAANNPVDVVVTDIEMESKFAGLYAMREIIKLKPDVKVIVYTKQMTDYHISTAFQFGACDYIVKTTPESEVAGVVLRAAQNRSIIHPEAAEYLRKEYIELKNAQENLAYTIKVILKLTPSEMDILRLLQSGMKYQEIAEVRFTEMTTMKTHISNLLRKFEKKNVVEMLETIESTGFFRLIDNP